MLDNGKIDFFLSLFLGGKVFGNEKLNRKKVFTLKKIKKMARKKMKMKKCLKNVKKVVKKC